MAGWTFERKENQREIATNREIEIVDYTPQHMGDRELDDE
jgi:hypothetical protein